MKYLKCNLVGLDCKNMITGETDEEIIEQFTKHYREVHRGDARALVNHIKFCIRTVGAPASPAHH